jgi:hypothetical protein
MPFLYFLFLSFPLLCLSFSVSFVFFVVFPFLVASYFSSCFLSHPPPFSITAIPRLTDPGGGGGGSLSTLRLTHSDFQIIQSLPRRGGGGGDGGTQIGHFAKAQKFSCGARSWQYPSPGGSGPKFSQPFSKKTSHPPPPGGNNNSILLTDVKYQ